MSSSGDAGSVITSTHNTVVASVARLQRARERKKTGRTLLEGRNLLEASVRAGVLPELVLRLEVDGATAGLCREAGVTERVVSQAVLSRLAPTDHPKGPLAVLVVPPPAPLEPRDTLVLVEIGDPGNAGTLVRSAAAFGFNIASSPGTVDLWAPKVLRAGAGSHFNLRLSLVPPDPCEELEAAGLVTVAATPRSQEPIAIEIEQPIALLIGSEPRGLPAETVARADAMTGIAMEDGVESLNAGVAGSILMYERARARRAA